jgi:hypothetical protein
MKKKTRYVEVDRIYSLRRERLGLPKRTRISELESGMWGSSRVTEMEKGHVLAKNPFHKKIISY